MAPHAGSLVRKSHIALLPVLHSFQQTAWRHMLVLLAARATSHFSQYYTAASRPHSATCWRSLPQDPHRSCPSITQLLADSMEPQSGVLGRKSQIALVPVLHSCQQTAWRHMLSLLAARATSPLSQYYTFASRPHGAAFWRSLPQEPHRSCPSITQLLAERMAPHSGFLGRKSQIALVTVLHICQQPAWRHTLVLLTARATSLLSQYYTVASRPHGATSWRS
jgi:hypothetical protein